MQKVSLSLFFLLFLNLALGQEISVLDLYTGEPLAGVAIYNRDKSTATHTNIFGKADISKFSASERIFFKHMTHKEVSLLKPQIRQQGNLVRLEVDENELDQVVLSAAKFEMRREETPQKVIGFNRADVFLNNPQTSADLLESSGQVYVQKSQMGGGSPMIRGFATNRLLITVDGVRMNTAIFRSGNLQNVISIDPLLIENTEVILGPASVVYGSDAVGGVMNFYSLKPRFAISGETTITGSAFARYSTAANEKTTHANFNIGTENWAFTTGVTYSDFGDLRMGSNGPDDYLRPEYVLTENGADRLVQNEDPRIQNPTAYNQINLLQKIKYMAGNGWDLNLGLWYSSTSNFPRYDRLMEYRNGSLRSAEWYYGPQDWFMGNFRINKRGETSFYDNFQFTAAYQNFKESRHNRNFGAEERFNSREKVDAYSFNLDLEKSFDESRIFYGGEYILNNVASKADIFNIQSGNRTADASRYPDGSSWQSLAAYSTYQWKINPKLSFQSGLRYNYIFIDSEFDDNFFDFPFSEANINTGSLTGSAGVNWRQNNSMGWRLNFSTAFRAPNIDDIGKIFDSEPGAVVVPNPELKPEYSYNGELGFDWTPMTNLSFIFTGFYTLLDNAMVRRDFSLGGETEIDYQGEPSRVQAIQNASQARVYGIEAGVEIDFSVALRLKSHFNYTRGEEELDNGETAPLRHAAPMFGNTHLIWHKKQLKFDLFAEYNGQFEYEDLAPSEQGKAYLYATDARGLPYSPSWYTLNFSGQYELNENWLFITSLENITDQRYRTYSSGIAAAGRNLILAVRYSF
ncbi:TonB-dependent receptor [Salegentibacter sp. HM20]